MISLFAFYFLFLILLTWICVCLSFPFHESFQGLLWFDPFYYRKRFASEVRSLVLYSVHWRKSPPAERTLDKPGDPLALVWNHSEHFCTRCNLVASAILSEQSSSLLQDARIFSSLFVNPRMGLMTLVVPKPLQPLLLLNVVSQLMLTCQRASHCLLAISYIHKEINLLDQTFNQVIKRLSRWGMLWNSLHDLS